MMRFRVASLAVVVLAALAAPSARAQSPRPAQKAVCYPIRYKNLREIPDESRTYEQQMEFERLKQACADAAVDNVTHPPARPQQQPAQRAAAVPEKPAPRAAEAAQAPAPQRGAEPAAASAARTRSASEDAPLRHGFWFSGGLGWGLASSSEDWSAQESGLSGGLSLGGTVSQHVQLGAGTNAWTKEVDGVMLTMGTLSALARIYPSSRGGFFFLGGLGVSRETANFNGLTLSETGSGAVLGIGYDIRVGRKVSLTPFYNGVGISNDLEDLGFAQLGLSVTFH